MLSLLLTVLAGALGAALLWLSRESRREGEDRTAGRALLLAVLLPAPLLAAAWLEPPAADWIRGGLLLGAAAVLALPLLPVGRPVPPAGRPAGRVDERTIMFSRAELEPAGERHRDYYAAHPEQREADDRFRRLPGLMSPRAARYEPFSFAAARASFTVVERLASLVTGPAVGPARPLDAAVATRFLKAWALKLGAVSCGVARLDPRHVYSVKGRGADYGRPVDLDHPFALAFTVEMDHRQLGAAPEGPCLMESAQQYLAAGAIATQLAVFLRELGWRAEAHIDGNYRVIAPLVARDAGLGEIGRMGLLMTPRLGPRVRLGVVTTDCPLLPDGPAPSPSVLHFCAICRKCAEACPAGAIPGGPRRDTAQGLRWALDQEACYTYWCGVGTDCGRCLRVCPYSHPDTFLHRVVRRGLRRSAPFRHLALRLDDLLYGRRPRRLPPAPWQPAREPGPPGDV